MDTPTAVAVLVDNGLVSRKAATEYILPVVALLDEAAEPKRGSYVPEFPDIAPGVEHAYRIRDDRTGQSVPPKTEYGKVLERILIDKSAAIEAISIESTKVKVFRVGGSVQYVGCYASVVRDSQLYRESLYLDERSIFECSGLHSELNGSPCNCRKNVPYLPTVLDTALERIQAALTKHVSGAPYCIARAQLVYAADTAVAAAVDAFKAATAETGSLHKITWPSKWSIAQTPETDELPGTKIHCAVNSRSVMEASVAKLLAFDKEHLEKALRTIGPAGVGEKLRRLSDLQVDTSVAEARLVLESIGRTCTSVSIGGVFAFDFVRSPPKHPLHAATR